MAYSPSLWLMAGINYDKSRSGELDCEKKKEKKKKSTQAVENTPHMN